MLGSNKDWLEPAETKVASRTPSNLNDSYARWSILGCRYSPFTTLNISCHSLLAYRVSAEKSAVSIWGVLL